MASQKKSVLFICLGNICRSPIAEAIFAHLVKERGLTDKWCIDSAALGPWHAGNSPDERALAKLRDNGVKTTHRARTLTKEDYTEFDVIFGMDDDNMRAMEGRRPHNGTASLEMLGDYDPKGVRIIEDPYYGEDSGFDTVYEQCYRCCVAFLEKNS